MSSPERQAARLAEPPEGRDRRWRRPGIAMQRLHAPHAPAIFTVLCRSEVGGSQYERPWYGRRDQFEGASACRR